MTKPYQNKSDRLGKKKPNVIFVFADQWRQQATGYAGDLNVKTPNLDALAVESVNFTHAISGCPVCSPYRASFLTGQRPMTHGVFVNDVCLQSHSVSVAQSFLSAGYDTAYIGKWHVDGHGRSSNIPPGRRMGFEYWKVLECTHDYNHSAYYTHDSEEKSYWKGYDAVAQTQDAVDYIRNHDDKTPFLMVLSWGAPHDPYNTAPPEYRHLYHPDRIQLRPNVPESLAADARECLAGYYAHCSALDNCVGLLLASLHECGIGDETVFVFSSDHGDMLGSHGERDKQRPWDESIRVPFLLRYSGLPGWKPRETDALIDAPDIMPTLLGLCGIPIPETCEGFDFSGHIAGDPAPAGEAALIMCPHPFGQWSATRKGGREYRGLRTKRYTYVQDLLGPWLLYDNELDPYQMRNRVLEPEFSQVRRHLDELLHEKLEICGDHFLPGKDYIGKWGYRIDETGAVPYED